MPTALTTATGREDLIEITISLAAHVRAAKDTSTVVQRMAVLTARYLNTMRENPDTGEAQHDELDTATTGLLDAAVVVGLLALDAEAAADGRLKQAVMSCAPLAHLYLLAANRKHNPGRATPPEPPPAQPPEPPEAAVARSAAEGRARDEYLAWVRKNTRGILHGHS